MWSILSAWRLFPSDGYVQTAYSEVILPVRRARIWAAGRRRCPEVRFEEAWLTAVHVGAPDFLEPRFWPVSELLTIRELARPLNTSAFARTNLLSITHIAVLLVSRRMIVQVPFIYRRWFGRPLRKKRHRQTVRVVL